MAEHYKFEMHTWRSPLCMACEEMLADAVDEVLSEADRSWFDQHVSTCAGCTERLADAQRGAAWLEMLKSPRPEPSAQLMDRILAATSESQPMPGLLPAIPQPAPVRILPFRLPLPTFRGPWLEPRLAMTAAMAFFSVALTLNLSGVKLSELHARDLSPTNLKRTYYQTNAEVSRYYENLRVVRVMESRVQDLRDANSDAEPEQQPAKPQPEQKPSAQPAPQDEKPDAPKSDAPNSEKPGPGVSRRRETPSADPRVLTGYTILNPRNPSTRNKEGGLA
jgi:hypothetical protein